MNREQDILEMIREEQGAADEAAQARARGHVIIRTSIIGILANLFLAGFKAVIGIFSNSIAIVLDAVNNLSDAASSLITIIGTKLAGRAPDRKHPFGHGRIEYLSAMIISVLVLYAGLTSLIESVKKILHPERPEYSVQTLVIIAAGVLVKIVLGRYVKGVGKRVNSDSLVNSGEDARLDAIISASTLAAALLFLWKGWALEAWLGAAISLFIIKSGVDMLRETLSKVLGERADTELARGIRETVMSFPDVTGAYDLVLHNYGPDSFIGSLHIEVPDTYSASELDELIRNITVKVYLEHHVILSAIGVYSLNTMDEKAALMRESIREAVLSEPHAIQMHGFYVNEEKRTIRFDVVISFDAKDRKEVYEALYAKVHGLYPDYKLEMTLDTDFSES